MSTAEEIVNSPLLQTYLDEMNACDKQREMLESNKSQVEGKRLAVLALITSTEATMATQKALFQAEVQACLDAGQTAAEVSANTLDDANAVDIIRGEIESLTQMKNLYEADELKIQAKIDAVILDREVIMAQYVAKVAEIMAQPRKGGV